MIGTIIERRSAHELRERTNKERVRLFFYFTGLAIYIVASVWAVYRVEGIG